MFVKVEPSGCCERYGLVQIRFAMYLEPVDYGYEKHHIQVPERPLTEEELADPILAALVPKVWQTNPFHNHFIYVEPEATDEEIQVQMAFHLPNFYEAWCQDYGEVPGGMRHGWDVKTRIRPKRYEKDAEREALVEARLVDIKDVLSQIKTNEKGETFPATVIDVGSAAIDGNDDQAGGNTLIDKANPANDTGEIDTFEIWAGQNLTGTNQVGTFHGSGTSYTSRDSEVIGSVTAGSKQTFSGLTINVTSGDFAGMYYSAGQMECDISGVLVYRDAGNQFGQGAQTYESINDPYALSLYGTGAIPPQELTASAVGITSSVATAAIAGSGDAPLTSTPVAVTSSIQNSAVAGTGDASLTASPVAVTSSVQQAQAEVAQFLYPSPITVASSVPAASIAGSGEAPLTSSPIAVTSSIQAATVAGSGEVILTASPVAVTSSVVAAAISGSGNAPLASSSAFALRFSGGAQVVNCGQDGSLFPATGTWEAWMKGVVATTQVFMSTNALGNTLGDAILTTRATNVFSFEIEDGLGGSDRIDSDADEQDGGIHYIVCLFGVGGMRMYVDHVLQADTKATTNCPLGTSQALCLGSERPVPQQTLDGDIYQVRISDKRRTQAEIDANWNGGAGHKFPLDADTVALWHIDEGTGSTVYDETENDNDGTITGASWTYIPGYKAAVTVSVVTAKLVFVLKAAAVSVTTSVQAASLAGSGTAPLTASPISVASSVVTSKLTFVTKAAPVAITCSVAAASISGSGNAPLTHSPVAVTTSVVNAGVGFILKAAAVSVTTSVVTSKLVFVLKASPIAVTTSVVTSKLVFVTKASPLTITASVQNASISGAGEAPLTAATVAVAATIQAAAIVGTGIAPLISVPILVTSSIVAAAISGSGSAPLAASPVSIAAAVATALIYSTGRSLKLMVITSHYRDVMVATGKYRKVNVVTGFGG